MMRFFALHVVLLFLVVPAAYAQMDDIALPVVEPLPAEESLIPQVPPVDEELESNADDNALVTVEPKWKGSLMFPDRNAENLVALYRAYMLSKRQAVVQDTTKTAEELDIEALLSTTAGAEEIPEEILQLSLNSIVYENANDWSIWVNGVRYSRETATKGFMIGDSHVRVIQASSKDMTYRWKPMPTAFDSVRERWNEKQRLENLATIPNMATKQHVIFDETARTVTVTMRPNQTFYSQFMSVVEGKGNTRRLEAANALEAGATPVWGESNVIEVPHSTEEEFIEDDFVDEELMP